MMRMHAPPGCLLVGWSVHLQPSTSFQLASFPVRESPEVMGSLPAAALMRGAATCLADSFSCYLSLKVTLELVAATKYLHRSQNQNQTKMAERVQKYTIKPIMQDSSIYLKATSVWGCCCCCLLCFE